MYQASLTYFVANKNTSTSCVIYMSWWPLGKTQGQQRFTCQATLSATCSPGNSLIPSAALSAACIETKQGRVERFAFDSLSEEVSTLTKPYTDVMSAGALRPFTVRAQGRIHYISSCFKERKLQAKCVLHSFIALWIQLSYVCGVAGCMSTWVTTTRYCWS